LWLSDLVEGSDLDGLDLFLEGLNLLDDVVDGDLLVLAREANDQLEDAEGNGLLLVLSLPEETLFLGDIAEDLLGKIIQISIAIERLHFKHDERHGNHNLLGLLDNDLGLGSLLGLVIVTEEIVEIIIGLLGGSSNDGTGGGSRGVGTSLDISETTNEGRQTHDSLKVVSGGLHVLEELGTEGNLIGDGQQSSDHEVGNGEVFADEERLISILKIFVENLDVGNELLGGISGFLAAGEGGNNNGSHGGTEVLLEPSDPLVDLSLLEDGLTEEAGSGGTSGEVLSNGGRLEEDLTGGGLKDGEEAGRVLGLEVLIVLLSLVEDDDLDGNAGEISDGEGEATENVGRRVDVNLVHCF